MSALPREPFAASSATHAWQWRDGCMVYSSRSVVAYNYRAARRSALTRQVEAEFAGLSGAERLWPRVANAAWTYLRRLKELGRRDSRARRLARPCKRCGAVFTPVFRIIRPFCSQRCANNAYYHRRYRMDPAYRERLLRESRARYARVKADPEKYAKKLAYHRDYAKRSGLSKRKYEAVKSDEQRRAAKNAALREWRAKASQDLEWRAKQAAYKRERAAQKRLLAPIGPKPKRKWSAPSPLRVALASSYGNWTVLREAALRGKSRYALCRCACGRETEVKVASLLCGVSLRCNSCASKLRAAARWKACATRVRHARARTTDEPPIAVVTPAVATPAAPVAAPAAIASSVERPRTRSDCLPGGCNEQRPCPWVGCRHHLYLDVNGARHNAHYQRGLRLNFPDRDVSELTQTCSLDVADDGTATQRDVATLLGVTQTAVAELEVRVVARLREKLRAFRDSDDAGVPPSAPPQADRAAAPFVPLAALVAKPSGKSRRYDSPVVDRWRAEALDRAIATASAQVSNA